MTSSSAPRGFERLAPGAREMMEALTAVFPDVGVSVHDAAEARRLFALTMPEPPREPSVGEVSDRLIPGPEGAPELPVRIYRPYEEDVAPGGAPTVVFFHGGGWVLGNLETHDATARAMCRRTGG